MTKEEVLIYGMIIQADIFKDGHGTTEKDEELHQKALFEVYGVKNDMSKEELEKLQDELENDKKELLERYRSIASSYYGT